MEKTIEDIIRSHINFTYGTSSKGWNTVYCEVCGDGKRTKGPRGGWLFSGDAAFYNCFNCGVEGNFDPTREQPYSENMRNILTSFNIDKKEISSLIYSHKSKDPNYTIPKKTKRIIKILDIPDHFYKLSDAPKDDSIAKLARQLLIEEKRLDPDDYTYYLSTGKCDGCDIKQKTEAKALTNRLIIPIFHNKNMIYYQARLLTGKGAKYLNPDAPKSSILYGMNRLYSNDSDIIFITDGIFDAMHVNGIAILENKMSDQQISYLNKSHKRKVVIPDKNGDSNILADQALELGWEVSVPNWGGNCKDVCEAVKKYGKLYTIYSITSSIYSGIKAAAALRLTK